MDNFKNTTTNNNHFPYIKVNIIYLVLFILLCFIIYLLYRYVIKIKYENTKIEYIQNVLLERSNGKEEKLILANKMPVSIYGNEYNISMWVKVLNYDYRIGAPKYILRKGDLEIFLHPTKNNLHIRIAKRISTPEECDDPEGCIYSPAETTTTTAESFENNTSNELDFINNPELNCIDNTNICNNKVSYNHNILLDKVLNQYKKNEKFNDITTTTTLQSQTITNNECIQYDFPLQKWVHISLNIYGNNIDIFIDGKLSSSCNLDILSSMNLSNMIISPNGGFDGEIAKVLYTNIKLSSSKIYKIYKTGPL
jgi:hypothetical protein